MAGPEAFAEGANLFFSFLPYMYREHVHCGDVGGTLASITPQLLRKLLPNTSIDTMAFRLNHQLVVLPLLLPLLLLLLRHAAPLPGPPVEITDHHPRRRRRIQ